MNFLVRKKSSEKRLVKAKSHKSEYLFAKRGVVMFAFCVFLMFVILFWAYGKARECS